MTVIVYMRHARRASTGTGTVCAAGVRAWFERYGLDYRRFVHSGLPAAELEATGDAFALHAVEIAREEARDG